MIRQHDGWTAAILAGGSARRLGGLRKTDLAVGGVPILERQLRELAACHTHPYLVCQDVAHYHDRRVAVLTDVRENAGPLGGLYTALLATGADRVLVLACDLPFLTAPFLSWLQTLHRDTDATVPVTGGHLHPLCAIYATTCLPAVELSLASGSFAMRELLGRVRVRYVEHAAIRPFDPDGLLFFNVNTSDDYAYACRHAPADAERRMLSHAPHPVKPV